MASTTPTDFWSDSCSIGELQYALEYGAVGATTNPVIVKDVLKNGMPSYRDRIVELIPKMPTASEDDIAWTLNEEMAIAGASCWSLSITPPKARRAASPSRPTPNTTARRAHVAAGRPLLRANRK